MNSFWTLAGCFVATLGPVTALHLMKRNDAGELLDAIVSTLMFTLAYGAGRALARWLGAHAKSSGPAAFVRGFAGGAVAQLVIWGVWMALPHDLRYAIGGVIGLPLNLLVCVAAGVSIERWSSRASHEASR